MKPPTNGPSSMLLHEESHEINGETFTFSTKEITVEHPDHKYPTNQRSYLKVTKATEGIQFNIGKKTRADITVVLFPGFSEVSGQFEGFLKAVLNQLTEKGYKNPEIYAPNLCEKGTESYLKNSDRASAIRLKDETHDAKRVMEAINPDLAEKLVVMGHSMGYLNALSYLETIDETRHQIKLIGLMPATDKPLGSLRPKFIKAVLKYVPQSLLQWLMRFGSIQLTEEDHKNMMFEKGAINTAQRHHELAQPDSARRFVHFVLMFKRLFKQILQKKADAKSTQAHIVSAKKDNLLPSSMMKSEVNHLEKLGIPTNYKELDHFNHAFPVELNEEQKEELERVLQEALNFSEHTHSELPEYFHQPQPAEYIQ